MVSVTPNEPLVSVVTPVYNGERYIARCIDSVLAQSYRNWELVILNNFSKDGTPAIARRYAAGDSRVRVLDGKEFVGPERNHNLALRQISPDSRYVKVLFGDDFIFPECLQRMVAVAERNPSVGIVGAYGLRGRKVVWDGLPLPASGDSTVLKGRDICRARLLGGDYVFGTPTSLLMRADLVRAREHLYNEANEHSDTEACYDMLRESDFAFVHQVLTYSHLEDGSLRDESRRLNSYLPGFLYDLKVYGPSFLTTQEIDTNVALRMRIYRDFLARSVLRREGRDFWKYHEQKLREIGQPLGRARITWRATALLLDAALNPKRTLENMWRGGAPVP